MCPQTSRHRPRPPRVHTGGGILRPCAAPAAHRRRSATGRAGRASASSHHGTRRPRIGVAPPRDATAAHRRRPTTGRDGCASGALRTAGVRRFACANLRGATLRMRIEVTLHRALQRIPTAAASAGVTRRTRIGAPAAGMTWGRTSLLLLPAAQCGGLTRGRPGSNDDFGPVQKTQALRPRSNPNSHFVHNCHATATGIHAEA